MSQPSPNERVRIDISSLISHQEIERKNEELLRLNQVRLEMLERLVGSDLITRFRIDDIKNCCPKLERSILNMPLGWTEAHALDVEITQLHKGKKISARSPALTSPEHCFFIHFYARTLPQNWDGRSDFMNEVGDVMATVDATGRLTSFQVLIIARKDTILTSQRSECLNAQFREGEEFIELLKPPVSQDAQARVLGTCDQVLRMLQQRGRLEPTHGR